MASPNVPRPVDSGSHVYSCKDRSTQGILFLGSTELDLCVHDLLDSHLYSSPTPGSSIGSEKQVIMNYLQSYRTICYLFILFIYLFKLAELRR